MSTTAVPTSTAPTLPERPVHIRIAQDLQVLATLALENPALGAEMARELTKFFVVLPRVADVTPNQFRKAAEGLGAKQADASEWDDDYFTTVAMTLPGRALQLVVTRLTPPAADQAVAVGPAPKPVAPQAAG